MEEVKLEVKNYYAMSEKELDKSIDRIRDWLFHYPNHENYKKVWFALEVALDAKKLNRDDFTQMCIDTLT